jgi:hypothetical protein
MLLHRGFKKPTPGVMEANVIRRIGILGALTAVLLAAGCAAPPPAAPPALVGAWRSSVQFESGAFASVRDLEFLCVFNAGGTMTESSNYDAAPPVPPAYGVWREVGPDEFEARYEFFPTAPTTTADFLKGGGWLPAGRGILTERIKLAPEGQTYTSTIRYEALGVHGEPIEGGGTARGRAERIRF